MSNETMFGVVVSFDTDPTVGVGVTAPKGSLGLRTSDGAIYAKVGALDTAWAALGNLSAALAALAASGGANDLISGTVPNSTLQQLVGDVTASTGSATTTIAADAVTNAKLRNSAALSVIGRSANSAGDPADIAASADGQVLVRSGGVLSFGPIPSSDVYTGGVITPPDLSSPGTITNNWDPFLGDTSLTIVRIKTTGAEATITGLQGGFAKRRVLVMNIGVSGFIIFQNDDGSSSDAANRFLVTQNITVSVGRGIIFWYDAVNSRWRATDEDHT